MTGYDIYDAGFEEGIEAALDYIEAMEGNVGREAQKAYIHHCIKNGTGTQSC